MQVTNKSSSNGYDSGRVYDDLNMKEINQKSPRGQIA